MARLGLSKENLISRGAARFQDLVYLALQDKKLHKKAVAHTRLVSVDEGEIANVKDLPWRAAGMCVAKLPGEKLVVVSGDGAVFTYVGGNEGSEKIRDAFDLRTCACIEGHAYAAGMNREVFRRAREGQWSAMHAPGVEGDDDVAGFEAIDGFGANDLYAAGWEGEVWHWQGSAWTQCESPVNVVLSGICCAGDGHVYACGQSGTLLRGRGEDWEVLETEGLIDDFWDVRWFMDRLYVASMSALYVLQDDALVAVDFGRDAPDSCYKLTDAEGVLWSIGQQNIFSFDGAAWRRWE
ncbi:hypothetical protein VAPA_1c06180 [Variovorax paradoxus B4]|uniref:Uncharacterized protein n=1 Tax=Variovorax paradoxus B4 TaxID=1246301 RepID=T1X579_VARPD|nr:hypothetical protein [Variovorax paradoxus]AGU47748.1 hypothetical protein VAPA_1c06180 [Variovorax paradoxus B4]